VKGPARSAGLVLFRRQSGLLEIFLAHPGGPFWTNRDDGAWTIPKGLVNPGEDPPAAARREFAEETGSDVDGELLPLGDVRLRSGKIVSAWAVEGDVDPATGGSNVVMIEWPPRSGRVSAFPEVDRCAWFDLETARRKIHPAQVPLLDRLVSAI